MALDVFTPVLEAGLSCAERALNLPAGRILIAPGGLPAWDDCSGGMVWSRVVEILPTGTVNPGQCGPPFWRVTLGVGVLRCAATQDDYGHPPSPGTLTAEAMQVTADAATLIDALQCCLNPLVGGSVAPVRWDPLGPDGGCVGGEWQVTVRAANCPCDQPGG